MERALSINELTGIRGWFLLGWSGRSPFTPTLLPMPYLRLSLLVAALATCACGSLSSQTTSTRAAGPPNIVVIFSDDQGWADIGTQGAVGFETPHIDRLAAEGARFTDFYVAQPVCSASRLALLTGCYPNRLGMHGAIGPSNDHGIHDDETTLAELCKSRGYATGMFGKWHLGYQQQFLPVNHGFDESYGIPYSNDMWPWHPAYAKFTDPVEKRKRGYPDLFTFEGAKIADPEVTGEDQMRFTTDFGDRAAAFVRANQDQPFFLYLANPMPHVPLFTAESSIGRSEQGAYGDVIEEIDDSVGKVLAALDEAGIADNTLVIYASDNGPWLNYGDHAGSVGPLREGKGTTFEGGVRVPCVVRFPGRVPAGLVSATPWMTIDLFPTIAKLIGADLPERKLDGQDAMATITGSEESPQDSYFFYYHTNHLEAVRSGKWKLHFPHGYRSMVDQIPGSGGTPGDYNWSAETELALFDLEQDIGESRNVAADFPEVVAALSALGDNMRHELGDKLTDIQGAENREPGRVPAE
ncbi:MAG: arylsulfatase A [Planctomycetota bacterium]|jgi:arylsulfatase A